MSREEMVTAAPHTEREGSHSQENSVHGPSQASNAGPRHIHLPPMEVRLRETTSLLGERENGDTLPLLPRTRFDRGAGGGCRRAPYKNATDTTGQAAVSYYDSRTTTITTTTMDDGMRLRRGSCCVSCRPSSTEPQWHLFHKRTARMVGSMGSTLISSSLDQSVNTRWILCRVSSLY